MPDVSEETAVMGPFGRDLDYDEPAEVPRDELGLSGRERCPCEGGRYPVNNFCWAGATDCFFGKPSREAFQASVGIR